MVKVMRILILIIAALTSAPVYASPSNLACGRSITSGKIMSQDIVIGSTKQIKLAKGGTPIECGSTLQAGDTGLTFVKNESTGSQYGKRAFYWATSHVIAVQSHKSNTGYSRMLTEDDMYRVQGPASSRFCDGLTFAQ